MRGAGLLVLVIALMLLAPRPAPDREQQEQQPGQEQEQQQFRHVVGDEVADTPLEIHQLHKAQHEPTTGHLPASKKE
jgi:hypothetical protein